jgi:predicted ATP-dependent endonuclease of OLD family
LVGINESGKTNLLKALCFLGEDFDPVRKDDLREALPSEEPITEAYVRFVFKLTDTETHSIYETVSEEILSAAINPEIVSIGKKNLSLKKFCSFRNEGLYSVNILKEKKSAQYWTFPSAYKIISGWKKPSSACPADFVLELKGQKFKAADYKLIRLTDFSEVPAQYFENATTEDLAELIGDEITTVVNENLPKILFWEYSEDNLLPSTVKIADFSANPKSCLPLKNMFNLAGITDIASSIKEARAGTHNQFQNYLNRIAKKTTAHFKDVWKEYREIEFSLELNADEIVPGIKEENIHDFARRSDGFKRFVTFLLLISVNVKTKDLTDTLLIIDEPDISLHPSGARYLRDELIRISKTNYVVYSTHSIFMIDSEDIGRHYLVKKSDEITTITKAESSNIADEEVLYNALGHSIFSVIKEKNIIFEGWSDKYLFKLVLENSSAAVKAKYKKVGFCHSKGAKAIKTITPMIELANRECLIISDADNAAKEQQKIYKKDKGFGSWKIYKDIDNTLKAITAEDFINNDFILKKIGATFPSKLPKFSDKLPEKSGKIAAIQAWLLKNGITGDEVKEILEDLKNTIFEDLKISNVDKEYYKLINGINP